MENGIYIYIMEMEYIEKIEYIMEMEMKMEMKMEYIIIKVMLK